MNLQQLLENGKMKKKMLKELFVIIQLIIKIGVNNTARYFSLSFFFLKVFDVKNKKTMCGETEIVDN